MDGGLGEARERAASHDEDRFGLAALVGDARPTACVDSLLDGSLGGGKRGAFVYLVAPPPSCTPTLTPRNLAGAAP